MGKAADLIRTFAIPVTLIAAVSAVVAINLHLDDSKAGRSKKPQAETTWHPRTSVLRPSALGEVGLREQTFERVTAIADLYEARLAPGYSDGRCFVEFGNMPEGRDKGDPTVAIAYAKNGIILETGDADLACNAQAIEQSSTSPEGVTRTVEDIVATTDSARYRVEFVHVTYVLGDVEPDEIVITGGIPEAGLPAPEFSEFNVFEVSSPDTTFPWGEMWHATFSLIPAYTEGA